jgi:hypothetical protein
MNARINTHALRQTTIESAQLGVLGSIAHPIAEDGVYSGTVFQRGIQIASFRLTVDAKFANTQVDVDLSKLDSDDRCPEKHRGAHEFELKSKGFVVLYVSEGPGDFYVVLSRLGEAQKVDFDSRTLKSGDLFIASMLRPGEYAMVDQLGKAKGRISVAYPKVGKEPYRPGEPARVVVSPEAFKPAEVKIGAAQAVVFSFETPKSAIQVKLEKPDDGPKTETPGRVRWTKPAASEK